MRGKSGFSTYCSNVSGLSFDYAWFESEDWKWAWGAAKFHCHPYCLQWRQWWVTKLRNHCKAKGHSHLRYSPPCPRVNPKNYLASIPLMPIKSTGSVPLFLHTADDKWFFAFLILNKSVAEICTWILELSPCCCQGEKGNFFPILFPPREAKNETNACKKAMFRRQ